jgi:hypothetical protein
MAIFIGPTELTEDDDIKVGATDVNKVYVGSNLVWERFIPAAPSQVLYDTPGTYVWTVPAGVRTISVACVGAGQAANGTNNYIGGDGGSLGWKNNIAVTPGQQFTVQVGHNNPSPFVTTSLDSWFSSTGTVFGGGGYNRSYVGDGGGIGGNGASASFGSGYYWGGGAGGAGGYTGNGGDGGSGYSANSWKPGNPGTGGGGGGGATSRSGSNYSTTSNRGGGVGIKGQGANGAGGSSQEDVGDPGSGGSGITYGGGGGGNHGIYGGTGAVRIFWGTGRSYPSAAGDV